MTILLTLLTALTIPALQADIETLDGIQYSGQLRALSVENAQIETPKGLETIPTDRLMKIVFAHTPSNDSSKGKMIVTLVDGSRVLAQGYEVKGENATLTNVTGIGSVVIPTRDISAVRFVNRSDRMDEAWDKLLASSADSDRVVIAKEDACDYHAGVLGDITDSRVVFKKGGDSLKLKRQKIFGVTYYHPAGRTLPKTLGKLIASDGSSWPFSKVTMEKETFKLTMPVGQEISFKIDAIGSFDFAEGKIAYLSDMKPESLTWTPYLALNEVPDAKENGGRATFFMPKFDRSFQAGQLILDGKTYEKGLAIHSRSVITYRLAKKYGRLTAVAGIADRVRPQGNVQLKIEADGRTLLDTEISGNELAIPIDLDLAQADRLTITVDYGQRTDIADHLILGDAKVMK